MKGILIDDAAEYGYQNDLVYITLNRDDSINLLKNSRASIDTIPKDKFYHNLMNEMYPSILIPKNCRYYTKIGKEFRFLIEEPPMNRTILRASRHMTESLRYLVKTGVITQEQTKEFAEKESFTIRTPYVVYIINVKIYEEQNDMRVYFNNKPIQSLMDQMYKVPLPNVDENGHVCFGNGSSDDSTAFYRYAIKNHQSIDSVVQNLINIFWNKEFNSDYTSGISKYKENGFIYYSNLFLWDLITTQNPEFYDTAELVRCDDKLLKYLHYDYNRNSSDVNCSLNLIDKSTEKKDYTDSPFQLDSNAMAKMIDKNYDAENVNIVYISNYRKLNVGDQLIFDRRSAFSLDDKTTFHIEKDKTYELLTIECKYLKSGYRASTVVCTLYDLETHEKITVPARQLWDYYLDSYKVTSCEIETEFFEGCPFPRNSYILDGSGFSKISKIIKLDFGPFNKPDNENEAQTGDVIKSLMDDSIIISNNHNMPYRMLFKDSENRKVCFPDGRILLSNGKIINPGDPILLIDSNDWIKYRFTYSLTNNFKNFERDRLYFLDDKGESHNVSNSRGTLSGSKFVNANELTPVVSESANVGFSVGQKFDRFTTGIASMMDADGKMYFEEYGESINPFFNSMTIKYHDESSMYLTRFIKKIEVGQTNLAHIDYSSSEGFITLFKIPVVETIDLSIWSTTRQVKINQVGYRMIQLATLVPYLEEFDGIREGDVIKPKIKHPSFPYVHKYHYQVVAILNYDFDNIPLLLLSNGLTIRFSTYTDYFVKVTEIVPDKICHYSSRDITHGTGLPNSVMAVRSSLGSTELELLYMVNKTLSGRQSITHNYRSYNHKTPIENLAPCPIMEPVNIPLTFEEAIPVGIETGIAETAQPIYDIDITGDGPRPVRRTPTNTYDDM